MVQGSIWKDTYYTAFNTSALTYYIKIDTTTGVTIFNGKAYALPDSDNVVINVSNICADYLNNDLTSLNDSTYTNINAVRNFYLYNSNGSLLETYVFSYDWSYEDNPSSLTPRYAYGQKVVETTKGSSAYTNTVSTYSDSSDYCGRYALIYLEPSGKWGSYLMEGLYKVEDKFNSYTTSKSYNNNTIQFGKNKYINEVTTSYELNTGWLNDAESELFAKNVVRSIKVYLQDIQGNKIVPVVITDTSVEHKKYLNEKILISYQVNVEESHNKEVR